MPPSNSENLLRTRMSPLREIARRILGRSAENPSDAQLRQVLGSTSPVEVTGLPGSRMTYSPNEIMVRGGLGSQDGSDNTQALRRALQPFEQTDEGMDPLTATIEGTLRPDRHRKRIVSGLRHLIGPILPRSPEGDQRLRDVLHFDEGYPLYGEARVHSDPFKYPYLASLFRGLAPDENTTDEHFPGHPSFTRLSYISNGPRNNQVNLDELQSDAFKQGGDSPFRRLWPRVLFNDAVLRALDAPKVSAFTWSPSDVHVNMYGSAPYSGASEMFENLYDRDVPAMARQLHRRLGVPYIPASYRPDLSSVNPVVAANNVELPGFRITDELRRAAEGVNRLVDDPRLSGFSLPLYAEGGGVAP